MKTACNDLFVLKFGGTSVADIERLHEVASRVVALLATGARAIVVVSAPAGETERLLALCNQFRTTDARREIDAVLASGEQINAGLMALALIEQGVPALSLLGWQIGLETKFWRGVSWIRSVGRERLQEALGRGLTPVVAGFQGVSEDESITTIGRGGSDLTAVAIASALDVAGCHIYTDVEGVHTADPRIVPDARLLDEVSYDEMLEISSLGSKVLQTRSVQLAWRFRVPLRVRSSFTSGEGTLLTNGGKRMEEAVVNGVVSSKAEAKVTLAVVPDRPGLAAMVFGALAEAGVNLDMIVQSASIDGKTTDITFTLPREQLALASKTLNGLQEKIGCRHIVTDACVAKVSVVGVGMRSQYGVAARVFTVLAEEKINLQAISTSEIRISVLIDEELTDRAVRVLHDAFKLSVAPTLSFLANERA